MESTEPGRYYPKFGQNYVEFKGSKRPVYYENGGQNLNPMKIWVRKIELGSKRRVKNIETVLNGGGGG